MHKSPVVHPQTMKKTTVAIFEDDQINRFIYEKLFEQIESDVHIHVFDNPEKGIAQAQQTPFDVVFIEIHFWKNFGGVSILDRLKEASSNQMLAVAMTSLLQEGDLEKITSSGFAICLEKPIAFEKIMPMLERPFFTSN
jgi:CheY-like chemotaxis protein